MNLKEYKFTREHEWVCPEPENKGKVGISDYAQSQLGDVVFIDLPAVGTRVEKSKKLGEIESVKTVSDLFSPVSGKILAINQAVVNEPQLLNQDPYGAGWLVRLELSRPSELDTLLNSDEYAGFIAGLD